jgi:hypothetical protein
MANFRNGLCSQFVAALGTSALVCSSMSAPVWLYLARQTSLTMSATVWRSLAEYLLETALYKYWKYWKAVLQVDPGLVTHFS